MVRLACVCFRCERRWLEFGAWPAICPYCSSPRIRKAAS